MEEVYQQLDIEELISQIIDKDDEKTCYLEEFIFKLRQEKNVKDFKMLTSKYLCDEIDEVLIETEASDNGGIIAMTGFYYQLLLTTKYIIEMLEGTWDRVVVDHHQDIIVYNHERIRFIQVKTKKTDNDYCVVSETKAYSEWIPKLLTNQKLFEGSNLKLEFELISNCTFLNAPKACKNFETFYKNSSFQNGDIDGDLYERLCEQKDKFKLTELEIKKGLKSFKVTKIDGKLIQDSLYISIGKYFNDYCRANDEIVNRIISFLFEKCYYPENVSLQIINNENLKELMISIGLMIQRTAEQEIIARSSDEIIGNFIDRLKQMFSKAPIYDDLLTFIDEFDQEVGGFFNKNETDSIMTVLSRFFKKTKYATDYRVSNKDKINDQAKVMFKVMVLIKFYFGGKLEIDASSNRLLVLSSNGNQFNLFGIEQDLFWDINQAINNFKDTFQSLDLEERLIIIRNPYFRIILSGSFDNDVIIDSDFIEVSCKDKAKIEQLSGIKEFKDQANEESIAFVKNKLFYIDAEDSKFDKILKKMTNYKHIEDIKGVIDKEFKLCKD